MFAQPIELLHNRNWTAKLRKHVCDECMARHQATMAARGGGNLTIPTCGAELWLSLLLVLTTIAGTMMAAATMNAAAMAATIAVRRETRPPQQRFLLSPAGLGGVHASADQSALVTLHRNAVGRDAGSFKCEMKSHTIDLASLAALGLFGRIAAYIRSMLRRQRINILRSWWLGAVSHLAIETGESRRLEPAHPSGHVKVRLNWWKWRHAASQAARLVQIWGEQSSPSQL